jgi:alkylation response protein AidB-like acyl-CoA dehydrogenase
VRLAPTPDQLELAGAVRGLLEDVCGPDVVRSAWSTAADGARQTLWTRLTQLDLLGAAVPESRGGLGLTEVDLLPMLVEVGRAAVPVPVAETVAVLAPLLAEAGDPTGELDALVAGHRVATAELATDLRTGAGPLHWGGCSSRALVREGTSLRLVDLSTAELVPVPTVDGSLAATVLPAPGSGTLLDVGPEVLERAWLRGVLATSAQLLGLAQRQLDLAVGYVAERRQFGVPVGSQQAVKHQLADALMALRFATPVVQRAAFSLSTGDPQARAHVAAAKAMTSGMAGRVARTAIQVHGAIGYTVEYDLHLYVKRSWALAAAWGGEAHHRGVVATSLDLPPAVDPSPLPWEAPR